MSFFFSILSFLVFEKHLMSSPFVLFWIHVHPHHRSDVFFDYISFPGNHTEKERCSNHCAGYIDFLVTPLVCQQRSNRKFERGRHKARRPHKTGCVPLQAVFFGVIRKTYIRNSENTSLFLYNSLGYLF